MSTILNSLLDHMAWADDKALEAIGTLPDPSDERTQATRLYAHLAAAAHIWAARIDGVPPRHPVWAELPLDEARSLSLESLAALRGIAARGDDSFGTVVDYRTSGGQPFSNTVGDILTHVVVHGCHHRGQLALLARQGGGVPAGTDYITFARERPAR